MGNLMSEAAGFLPVLISVYADVDPTTCQITPEAENTLTVSAFLGILAQFILLGAEILPMIYEPVVNTSLTLYSLLREMNVRAMR